MTERIQHIIDEIKIKCHALHNLLNAEREKSTELNAEIVDLTHQLNQFRIELDSKNQEIVSLKKEVEETKSQVVEIPMNSQRSHEEIDELVKEIEYCIKQLKK